MPNENENRDLEEAKLKEEQRLEEESQVPKKAFTEVSNSMHKYKSELKETKLLLNQMQAEKEATKNEQLAEQGRWKELYDKSQSSLEVSNNERKEEQDKFVNYHKKNSVLTKIGGFKRDEYNNFINVKSITLNEDGSIESSSLIKEVDRIRQTYPELLNGGSAEKLSSNAPSNNVGDRDYNSLSLTEKDEYRKNLLKKPEGY